MNATHEYDCALCGGHFSAGRSAEVALAESRDIWGAAPLDQLEVICDDCARLLSLVGSDP